MGPAVCYGPGAISMKEDWVRGAPLHSHTQISYAGTRDNSRQWGYMPATIGVARGLLSPIQWCGQRFSAEGKRVNLTHKVHAFPNFYIFFVYVNEHIYCDHFKKRKSVYSMLKVHARAQISCSHKNRFQTKSLQLNFLSSNFSLLPTAFNGFTTQHDKLTRTIF